MFPGPFLRNVLLAVALLTDCQENVGRALSFQETVIVPATFSAKVVAIKDGDTIDVLYGKSVVRVRLAHIDTPESGQPFGKAAKQRLSSLCYGKAVRVERAGRPDRYGRLISVVIADGTNVNKAMVRSGYAWHFIKYSKDASYTVLQEQARSERRGLWADPAPVPPWAWRAARRNKKK